MVASCLFLYVGISKFENEYSSIDRHHIFARNQFFKVTYLYEDIE